MFLAVALYLRSNENDEMQTSVYRPYKVQKRGIAGFDVKGLFYRVNYRDQTLRI